MSSLKSSVHSSSVPPILKLESLHSTQSALTGRAQVPLRTAATGSVSRRTVSSDWEVEERREVEQLSEWNKPGLGGEVLSRITVASFGQSARSGKNDVEKLILFRRSKGSTLRGSEGSSEAMLKHIQEVSYRRMLKKEEEHLGKERSQHARRYEDELHSTIHSLQSSLSSLRSRAKALREEASSHRTLILQLESSLKSTKKSFFQTESISRLGGKTLRPEDVFRFITKKSQQQAFLFSREMECRDKVLISKDAIFRLRTEAVAIDQQATAIEHELEAAKSVETAHFLSILKQGKDTRGQGLAWIVKKLWKAGETVSDGMFPDFLDEEAVRIVLFIAQKSMEADELGEYLLSVKPPVTSNEGQNTHDHWNNIHSRLKELTVKVTWNPPKSQGKPIVFVEGGTNPMGVQTASSDVLVQCTDVKTVESRIKSLQELIHSVQTAEIRRLTTECFLNSYEKKYKVTLKLLLSAIVGVDVLDRYLATVNKEQKTLAEQLSQTKTFYFMSSNA